jgi:outer membrane protein assembly factor BamB
VPPVTHTHALFAEESQSIPNNLVALSGHILGPERAICGGDFWIRCGVPVVILKGCYKVKLGRKKMRAMPILNSMIVFGLLTLGIGDLRGQEDPTNWPMYGRDLRHSFSNQHSLINPTNVATLKPAWDFMTGDVVSASPAVVGRVVFVGSWDGYFYAIDATEGSQIWKFQVDCQNTVIPIPPQCLAPNQVQPNRFLGDGGIITSSAAVVDNRVYFGAGKTVYSLNAGNGSLRWKTVICGNPDRPGCAVDAADPNRIFSSPAILGNNLFIGHTVDGADGYRGGIEALDIETGKIRWRFEVDPILDTRGEPLLGSNGHVRAYNRGCGNVWSSAAVDVAARLVFFGTGDCNNQPTLPYHNAVISLEADTGRVRWVFRPQSQNSCDYDFGASANIINFRGAHYLGIGGKDGTYYLIKRRTRTDNPRGQLKWATNLVFGGDEGGFIGSTAFDGQRVFGATAIGDGRLDGSGLCAPSDPRDTPLQEPSMHALSVDGGRVLWQQNQNHSAAPTTVANGVVFSGLLGLDRFAFAVNAYDAENGQLLASFEMPGSVNSATIPLADAIYVGSGTTTDGSGSGVHALALP